MVRILMWVTSPALLSGFGFTSLEGVRGSMNMWLDLNLFYKPAPHFSIVPSIRVQKQDTVASAVAARKPWGWNAVACALRQHR